MENLYRTTMAGIGCRIAMQSIRTVVRDKAIRDEEKLKQIIAIVHSYEEDAEDAYHAEERRAMEADEAQMQKERIDDMFEGMVKPLDELWKGGKKDE